MISRLKLFVFCPFFWHLLRLLFSNFYTWFFCVKLKCHCNFTRKILECTFHLQSVQDAFETKCSLEDFKVQRLDHCNIGWSLDRYYPWSQSSNKRRRLVTEGSDVCQVHWFTLFTNVKSHHHSIDCSFFDCRCGIPGFESIWWVIAKYFFPLLSLIRKESGKNWIK